MKEILVVLIPTYWAPFDFFILKELLSRTNKNTVYIFKWQKGHLEKHVLIFKFPIWAQRIETDTILPITIVYSEKVPKQTANKN